MTDENIIEHNKDEHEKEQQLVRKENDDTHKVEGEDTPIKEKEYISECQKCGQPLFLNAKSLDFEVRETFGCGYKVIKLDGKYLCHECLVNVLWDEGKQKLKLKEVNKMEDKNLVVREAIVMPAVSKEKAVEAFNAYQDLAKEIIRPEDIQKIQGKDFKKKSFWRKCQRFFNLSLEKIEERREEHNGAFTYHFIYRAIAPNSAFVDGTGSCSSNEKGLVKTEHIARATAETRAKNRAIADLVAFGEVSAEEMITDSHEASLNVSEEVIERTLEAEKERTTELLKDNIATPVCEKCKKELTVKVYNYSSEKFGRPLCYDCQKKG